MTFPDGKRAARDVLLELRRRLELMRGRDSLHRVTLLDSGVQGTIVWMVYTHDDFPGTYGLRRDVAGRVGTDEEPDALETATMIRVGDLGEPPPETGSVVDAQGIRWWGDAAGRGA